MKDRHDKLLRKQGRTVQIRYRSVWHRVAGGIVSPEGPAADQNGNVYLVSRWTGRVLRVDRAGVVCDLVSTGGKPQSVALLDSGDLLLADTFNHALQQITPTGQLKTICDQAGGRPLLGPNDLVIGLDNVVYMTDPGDDLKSRGQLVRVDLATGFATVLDDKLFFPNGITISEDGRHLYVAESTTHRIIRFEFLEEGRRLGPAEIFHQFDDFCPDGIAFDAEGFLLVALYGSGTLALLSPSGTLIESIATGGKQCTNCVFGGRDFQTLYVTEDDQEALLHTRWPRPGQRRFSRSQVRHFASDVQHRRAERTLPAN